MGCFSVVVVVVIVVVVVLTDNSTYGTLIISELIEDLRMEGKY